MGSSLKIQDTNLDITKFTCSQCQQPFTEQDKENDNWDLWWNTSNSVIIEGVYYNNNGLALSIWVRDITHKFEAQRVPYYDAEAKTTKSAGYKLFNCPEIKKEVVHE